MQFMQWSTYDEARFMIGARHMISHSLRIRNKESGGRDRLSDRGKLETKWDKAIETGAGTTEEGQEGMRGFEGVITQCQTPLCMPRAIVPLPCMLHVVKGLLLRNYGSSPKYDDKALGKNRAIYGFMALKCCCWMQVLLSSFGAQLEVETAYNINSNS